MTTTWKVELISEPTVLKPEGPWATLCAWSNQRQGVNQFSRARDVVEERFFAANVEFAERDANLEARSTWGNIHLDGNDGARTFAELTAGQLATLTALVDAETPKLPPMPGPPKHTLRVTFTGGETDRVVQIVEGTDPPALHAALNHCPFVVFRPADNLLRMGAEIERAWVGRGTKV